MKEKLKELLIKADENAAGKLIMDYKDAVDDIADYLLNNGVIVPPCKVGDTVYWYNFVGELTEAKVVRNGFYAKIKSGFEFDIRYDDIGKTVFLSREEAEAALKGVNYESSKAD